MNAERAADDLEGHSATADFSCRRRLAAVMVLQAGQRTRKYQCRTALAAGCDRDLDRRRRPMIDD